MGIARVAAKHYAFTLLRRPLGLLSLVATSHILSTDGRGLLTVVYLIPNMVLLFADIGVSSAAMHFIGRGLSSRRQVLSTMLASAFCFGVIWSLLIALAYATVPGIVSDQVTWVMHTIILIQLPFTVLNQALAKMLIYEHRVGREFLFEFVIKAGNLASLLMFGLWLLRGAPASDVVLAILCTTLTLNIVRCVVLLGRMKSDIAGTPSWTLLRELVVWGAPLALTASSMFLLHFGDQYLLQLLGADPLTMVGIYTVAYSIFMEIVNVSRSVSSIFLRVSLESGEDESDRLSLLIARRVALLTIGLACVLAVAAPWVIDILTPPQFGEASEILRILLLCAPFAAFSAILERMLAGRAKFGRVVLAPMIAVSLNIALNILWIPEYGIQGAAWATVAAYGLLFIIRFSTCLPIVGAQRMFGIFAFSFEDVWFFVTKAKAIVRIARGT